MPHPILKRAQSAQHAPAPPRSPPAHPSVHFPPSPSLTRTFSAHSPAYYDRSPIEVAPNTCALPARGCPGRTYYDGPTRGRSAPEQQRYRHGKSLHPRALAAYEAQMYQDDDDEDDSAELERTPTRTSPYIPLPVPPPIPQSYPYSHAPSPYSLPASTPHHPMYYSQSPPAYQSFPPPPPLVPDLSSSSDESDGLASPPPGPAVGFFAAPGKYPYSFSPYPATSYPAPPSYPPQMPSSAVPYERKRRSRKSSPRRPVVEDGDAGYEEEDLPGSFSHAGAFVARVVVSSPPLERTPPKPSKDGRSRKEPRQKKDRCVAALCRSLAGTGFRDESEACLGGF